MYGGRVQYGQRRVRNEVATSTLGLLQIAQYCTIHRSASTTEKYAVMRRPCLAPNILLFFPGGILLGAFNLVPIHR